MEIRTVSGNFKARFTAAENPYAYLLASDDDSQVEGFCQILYSVGMLLTTDQEFVDSITKALRDYDKRLNKKAASEVAEDETEEKIALEEVKQVQAYVEMPEKERKKRERDVNGRFKKAVRNLQEESEKE
jgi:Predicted membrane protein